MNTQICAVVSGAMPAGQRERQRERERERQRERERGRQELMSLVFFWLKVLIFSVKSEVRDRDADRPTASAVPEHNAVDGPSGRWPEKLTCSSTLTCSTTQIGRASCRERV